MLGLKLTGSTSLDCLMCDRSGIGVGGTDGLLSCVGSFREPSLI